MSLIANNDGEVRGRFSIPEGLPAGSKEVVFSGPSSMARATFIGQGHINTIDRRRVLTTHTQRTIASGGGYDYGGGNIDSWAYVNWGNWSGPWYYSSADYPNFPGGQTFSSSYNGVSAFDPLAQTFVLASTTQVMGVDLWFTTKGTGRQNVLVQLREVVNGIPSYGVIAQATLNPDQITLDAWTRFAFPPATLNANQEYAIVVGANDSVSAIATATLGEYDAAAAQWVTSQPYQIGVMLSSSNNLTWTPHQTSDLTFRLLATAYPSEVNTPPTRTIALEAVDVVDADQLIILATVERPNAACHVVFKITAGSDTYQVMERQVLTLRARFTGTLTWEAVLTGTPYASPVLYKDLQLVAGERLTSSNYISAALDTKVSPTRLTVDMHVYVDTYLPSGTTLTATAEVGAAWLPLDLVGSTELGEGWVEQQYLLEDIAETQTRLELVMTGTAVRRPILRNLRVALT